MMEELEQIGYKNVRFQMMDAYADYYDAEGCEVLVTHGNEEGERDIEEKPDGSEDWVFVDTI